MARSLGVSRRGSRSASSVGPRFSGDVWAFHPSRPARLARAVVRGGRLGALRAHPGGPHRDAPTWSGPLTQGFADDPSASASPTPSAGAFPTPSSPGSPRAEEQTPGAAGATGGGSGLGVVLRIALVGVPLLAVLALLLAAPALVRARRRRRCLALLAADDGEVDPDVRAEAAWREICDDAWDLGVRWPPEGTVRTASRVIRGRIADGQVADTVEVAARAVERVRFGPPGGAGSAGSVVVEERPVDVTAVRRALAQSTDTATRRRGRWPPGRCGPGPGPTVLTTAAPLRSPRSPDGGASAAPCAA